MPILAYYDGSGTHASSKALTLNGAVAQEEAWVRFDAAWKKALPTGITRLHMKEVKELTPPIWRISFQTEKPRDSKGRRLRRLLDATCTAFAATSKDPGESVGDDIGTQLSDTFKNSGPPTSESVVRELAEQVLALLHEVVKAKFSVATSPRTYAAIDVIRGWFREHEWEEAAEASPRLDWPMKPS